MRSARAMPPDCLAADDLPPKIGVARELAGWCWSLAVMDGAEDNSAAKRQR